MDSLPVVKPIHSTGWIRFTVQNTKIGNCRVPRSCARMSAFLEQVVLNLLSLELSSTAIVVGCFLEPWSPQSQKVIISFGLGVIVVFCTCTTSRPSGQKYASDPSLIAI